jgi:hypothetical protein
VREDPPVAGSTSWPPSPLPGVAAAAPPAAAWVAPGAPPATAARPGRRRLLLIALAVVVLAGAGAGIGLAVGGSGPTGGAGAARSLLARALADARAAGSFHYVSTSRSSSGSAKLTQVTVGDAGGTEGRQAITVNGDRFRVLVVGATSYFQGDAVAMAESLGVPASVAEAHAGQWISLVSGDSPYQSVTAAVTTSSALEDNVTFRATEELAPSKLDGRLVQGLEGPMQAVDGQQAHGTATLYVTTGRRPVPVRYVERGTVGKGSSRGPLDFTLSFSAWAEPVSVPAPAGATSFASLGVSGGAPSGPGPTLFT